jgi:hypothetical protein
VFVCISTTAGGLTTGELHVFKEVIQLVKYIGSTTKLQFCCCHSPIARIGNVFMLQKLLAAYQGTYDIGAAAANILDLPGRARYSNNHNAP